jgi:hypothetical protein
MTQLPPKEMMEMVRKFKDEVCLGQCDQKVE